MSIDTGFEDILVDLSNSIKKDRLHHAIMICGKKGAGKFEFSKRLAARLLTNDADNKNILNNSDLRIIKKLANKKNISVDQIRPIASFFQSTSAAAGKKIVIINAIDDFNKSSANAILKTLEEPNKNCYLIILCHSLAKAMPTIKSRCKIYKANNLSFDQFEEAFYNIRPSFLPKLNPEEIKILSILTNNTPRMAIEMGDDLATNYTHLIESFSNNELSPQFIKTISSKSFDFSIANLIIEVFFNRLTKYCINKCDDICESERVSFSEIRSKKTIEEILDIYHQAKESIAKTTAVNLDKKLVLINIFNKLHIL